MQRGDCGEHLRALDRFERRQRCAESLDQLLARNRDRRRVSSGADRSDTGPLSWRGRSRAPAQALSNRGADAARAARPFPMRRLRAHARQRPRQAGTAACFNSASSVTGSSPLSAACATSRAKTPASVSGRRSPPESSASMFQRISAAATRRASARSGVTSAAVLFSCTASRSATAIASASSSALAASMTVMPANAASRAAASRCCRPVLGRLGRAQRLRGELFARAARAERNNLVARNSDPAQQPVHRKLRMPERGSLHHAPAVLDLADQLPGALIEIGIEPRQHHGAVRQLRDGGEQARGRRHRAGGAGGDHRRGIHRKADALGLDQQIAARGRLDLAFGFEQLRPVLGGDFQEAEGELPVAVEIVGHQAIQPFPRDLPRRHVVDQAREIVGERERRSR